MPEKIVHNLTTWKDDIELALVFWFIGATIGIGQHLLSPDRFSWRVIVGRALSTGGLAVVSGAMLMVQPNMCPLAQMGIAAGIASLGTAALEMAFMRFVIGRKTPDANELVDITECLNCSVQIKSGEGTIEGATNGVLVFDVQSPKAKGAWSIVTYTFTVKGANSNTRIAIASGDKGCVATGKNRMWLDKVTVVKK